ncbi:MAG: methyl-accepting chemotaxis protein [Pseudomonadota bacterium]
MQWIKNLKVGAKLTSAFVIVSVITGMIGWIGINNMSTINSLAEQIYDRELLGISFIKEANINLIYGGRAVRELLLATSEQERLNAVENIKKFGAAELEFIEKSRSHFVSEKAKALFARYEIVAAERNRLRDRLVTIINNEPVLPQRESATFVGAELRPQINQLDEMLTELSTLKEENAATASKDATAIYQNSRSLMIILILGGSAIGLVLGFFISRAIARPLNDAVAVANKLAEGDLTAKIEVTSKDETGMLLSAMQNMVSKLSSIIGEVRSSADNLSSASEQVSSTAQSMSQATSEQAASVEETSASIEQMSASINNNTENAKVTDGMASKAAKEATEGGESVNQTVSAMKQIAKRISIIDDIAYQTNLLALNAAIEAARAGEHGKGFAVVAAEVRKLAERSQIAAQEIGELSSSSVEMAEKAGMLLNTMLPSITKTSDLVQEISAASEEQATGVAQINTAMTQLNQITQQNASSSEELAATAEEMSSQAEQLQQAMSFFTVAQTGTHSASAKTPINKKDSGFKKSPNTSHSHLASLPISSGNNSSEFTRF